MSRAKSVVYGGALLLVLLAAVPVRAAEEGQPKSYVVLVGVSNYADKQILPKPHAEADVKALYDLFTSKDHLGVDANHIRLLLGSKDEQRRSEPATHANILQALRWAVTKAGRDDLVLFAFIGQGAPLGDRTCYFGSDATFKDRAKNAVAAAEIAHELDKLQSQKFCALLDVNFKAFDSGSEPAPDPHVANFYKEFLGKDEEGGTVGRILFLANRSLAPSLTQGEHGLFTKVVVDGLKGAADKEGYEPDGLITVDELAEHLEKELTPLEAKLSKNEEELREHTHFVLGGRSSHFALTQNPAAMPKVQERLAKLAELAKDGKLAKELAEEGQNLLSRMPKLKAYHNLRKEYQRLADGAITLEDFTKSRDDIFAGMKLRRTQALAFARRVMEATQVILDNYVKEVNQGQLVAWGIQGLYRRIDEKMPEDIKKRLEKPKDLKPSEMLTLLADVRERLGNREDLDNHKDLDHTLQRMLFHLDRHTTYIDPEMLARFRQETSGNFTGIGVQIRKETNRDMLLVITPIRNSPAYKAGMKAGDIITKITREVDSNGKPLDPPEVIPTKGLPLNEAVKKILGRPNTKVKLTVEREGVPEPLEFEITRSMVETESVHGFRRKADDSWDFVLDPANRICYARLSGFAENTYRDLRAALTRLEKEGIKGLILDLRNNPGGLLESAVFISDMFIEEGNKIVSIRRRDRQEQKFIGKYQDLTLDKFPMVCLINGDSASGSEIVAACLQDYGRAIIVGERSYGKGSVQNIQDFAGGKLKFTSASFWRPSGKNLNRSSTNGREEDEWGVSPNPGYALKLSPKEAADLEKHMRDVEIIPNRDLPPKEPKTEFKDKQLEMALSYLRGQIKTVSQAGVKKAG
jgi:C-terminal peptidase prc